MTENQPASLAISAALRADILAGVIEPGARLRQDELASRFGTSRIPVREALRQLEAEALVINDVHRGARVAPLTLDETLERMEIRVALECAALKLAVPAMSELDFEMLETILAEYDLAEEPAQWTACNWAFHTALYAPCNRPTLLALIQANITNADRFLRLRLSQTTGKERPQIEHREILAACRAGDAARAAALLEGHIARARKSLATAMRLSRPAR
ncbi:MAG: GntR family transcriptional regulator [Rubritepida sp.]|nr:GntR family transcriptional regulator [Rubritepida sp.]